MVQKKPEWLRIRMQGTEGLLEVKRMLDRLSLHTVCQEANCPNIMECFGKKTATFMILGNTCTRNCTFCNVTKGEPAPPDPGEPSRVAQAVKELGLKHAVITSVTRDDLADGGAGHFAEVIREIKKTGEEIVIEVLVPDFKGSRDALSVVVEAGPQIINHNLETVPRLYPEVRPRADYRQSLELLRRVKEMAASIRTKSGIMLGLGEERDEVIGVMRDLRDARCDLLTIGQYLAPSERHHPVVDYVHPGVFQEYKEIGLKMGFSFVASAPLVRSSYHAGEAYRESLA
ncbi:MAG: lipoyl synthase [Peptococcaceae bacterium]|jgi:lipoic acid synthetase|nr:lipoyl synthase [Peptococcaceae bacterium]MDH7524492.1 lipoyl synthase [Peptococcaceae bacterium]